MNSFCSYVEYKKHSDRKQIGRQGGCGERGIDKDCHYSRSQDGHNTWGINAEDIDPSVLDELPVEIQREIREWVHPRKRTNISRKCSSIVHYFSPAEKG